MATRKMWRLIVGLFVSVLLVIANSDRTSATGSTGTTSLVSRHSDGTPGDNPSQLSDLSADGRFVVFFSNATNLIENDLNGLAGDVFIHDRQTGETSLISKASDGSQGNADSAWGNISPDGRYVVFFSNATNLGAQSLSHLYIHDRQTGQTTPWDPRHSDGTVGNRAAAIPVWSADARYMVYMSSASNLVDDDTNDAILLGMTDIFVHDNLTGETTMVSRHSNGTQGNGSSYEPDISADGRYVTFTSEADNLVDTPLPDYPYRHVYLHDRQTGQTVLVSRNSNGTAADLGNSDHPSISGDGRYIAYTSSADNLDPNDDDGDTDIFIYDRVTGQTIPASQNSFSRDYFNSAGWAQISADGRYVAFDSQDTLTAGPGDDPSDIFVYDRVLNSWKLVSHHSDGTPADDEGHSGPCAISADGQVIAFFSLATTLVDVPVNGGGDVFTHELALPVAPTAAFGGAPLSGTAPLAVSFTDQSTGEPTSWAWNFGDGGTSTAQNPSHTYTAAGTYTVSLTATNAQGSDGETKTAYVTVSAPLASPSLYVSATAAGTVGGVTATPQDILYRNGAANTWAMHFDGSDVGLIKAIAAFARLANGDLLLTLKANQSLPGVGPVTPWDVVRFAPTTLGNNTAGTFSWYIDGSDVGLTTAAEKIDALDALPDGRVLVSTGGALAVPKQGGGTQKAQDEDLVAFLPTALGATTTGAWSLYFNGTAVPGMSAEDVVGADVDAATGTVYVAILGPFTIGGVSGNDRDVLKLAPSGGTYAVSPYWRGGNHGFNLKLGGIELP